MTTSADKMTFHALLKRPACLLALGLGSGLSPKAPGTVGTLAAIPFYLLMQHLSLGMYLLVVLVSFMVGVWLCQRASDWLQEDDASPIVWDEFVGFWVTMIAAPTGWLWIVLGFVLFRFFDIIKPWPVSVADKKLHGGLGVMLDDVLAGGYAAILIQVIYYTISN